MPANDQTCEFVFKDTNQAKLIYKEKSDQCSQVEDPQNIEIEAPESEYIKGIMLKRDQKNYIISPELLEEFTDLQEVEVNFSMYVPFQLSLQLLLKFLIQQFGINKIEQVEESIIVKETVKVTPSQGRNILLQWKGLPENDSLADAISVMILNLKPGWTPQSRPHKV